MNNLRYYISRTIARFLPDKLYLSIKFRSRFGYWMDWNNPKTFNEKMQWLKLYDVHPEFTQMVDKVAAKDYVASIIGNEYIIPTLNIYNSVDEINFDELPNQFVLKCTHDSGGLVICKDKRNFDIEEAKIKLKKGLKRSYVIQNREYPYKNVPRRIIAEQYMEDESGTQLKDYKIFCFNGIPKFIEVDYDRYTSHKLNVYDLEWNFLDFYMTSPNDNNVIIKKPSQLKTMLEIASALSKDKVFLRVDLYSINDMIYFGEMTFTPGSGMIDFHPKKYDLILGEMLQLPIKK